MVCHRDQHAAQERAQGDAGIPARRDQAVGPRDVLGALHDVRDGRGGRRPERDLGERRDEPHGHERAGPANQREPEEGHRARQVGQDHHALTVEPVAQHPAEGTEGAGDPMSQQQRDAEPGRGPTRADEDGVQQRGVGGRAPRFGDGPS
jgi:hypothetical protein